MTGNSFLSTGLWLAMLAGASLAGTSPLEANQIVLPGSIAITSSGRDHDPAAAFNTVDRTWLVVWREVVDVGANLPAGRNSTRPRISERGPLDTSSGAGGATRRETHPRVAFELEAAGERDVYIADANASTVFGVLKVAGPLGGGRELVAGPLAAGVHRVRLEVAGGGATVSAEVEVTVLSDRDGDGIDDATETAAGLDPYDPDDVNRDEDEESLATGVEVLDLGSYPTGLLAHLFLGGAAPRAPGPRDCGEDPTADTLERCDYREEACR